MGGIYLGGNVAASSLRHGNTIALRAQCWDWSESKFLGCGGFWSRDGCGMRACPGSVMSGDDWSKCWGEVFRMFLYGGSSGDVIRYGNKVTVWSTTARYVSCDQDAWCQRSSTATGFYIYSRGRAGGCSGYPRHQVCEGEPIQDGDVIYLEAAGHGYPLKTGYFVSADGSDVSTRTCPDTRGMISSACSCEKWTLFIR